MAVRDTGGRNLFEGEEVDGYIPVCKRFPEDPQSRIAYIGRSGHRIGRMDCPDERHSSKAAGRMTVALKKFELPLWTLLCLLFLPFALPAEWVFGKHTLAIDKDALVITQSRDAWINAHATWNAQIYEYIETKPEPLMICHGGGYAPYSRGVYDKPMSINVWTGDNKCSYAVQPVDVDRTFYGSASWTTSFFIWSWTEEARTKPFTLIAK